FRFTCTRRRRGLLLLFRTRTCCGRPLSQMFARKRTAATLRTDRRKTAGLRRNRLIGLAAGFRLALITTPKCRSRARLHRSPAVTVSRIFLLIVHQLSILYTDPQEASGFPVILLHRQWSGLASGASEK